VEIVVRMNLNSVTFSGSLGELVRELRDAARAKNRWALVKIFPDVKRGRSISGDFESLGQYYKDPRRLPEFLRKGLIRINLPFFDSKIPELEKVLCAFYPQNPAEVDDLRRSFSELYSALRKARQYFGLSQHAKKKSDRNSAKENFNDQIDQDLKKFNDSLSMKFEKWKIPVENLDASLSPEERKWKISLPWPLKIEGVSALIDYAEKWKNYLRNRPKSGRPPKSFNAFLFHAVNAFTYRVFDAKGNYVRKGEMYRVRKNWQLVFAALLWLHVNEEIPEMRKFIREHENEMADVTLKKFAVWAKREYSHFRESDKGQGKFGPPMARDGTNYLGIPFVYVTDKALAGRLV
jgi:hypothetical protein